MRRSDAGSGVNSDGSPGARAHGHGLLRNCVPPVVRAVPVRPEPRGSVVWGGGRETTRAI